jgi:hypothetical protein
MTLPDGRAGAKWNGLVFPLLEGTKIDVAGTGVLPQACGPAGGGETSWRYEPDSGGDGGYVFFDGTGALRNRTLAALAEAGIDVLRSGANLSGMPGDWFVRLAGAKLKILATFTAVLGAPPAESEDDASTSLRERLLAEALEQARVAVERLQEDLAETRRLASETAGEAAAAVGLRAELDRLATQLGEADTAARQARTGRLQETLGEKARLRLDRELEVVAKALLPRLEFVGDSLRFMAVELIDRASIWRVLGQLHAQERGQPAGWKSLSGHTGWWERHFSTGQDEQGRIYARFAASVSGWRVLVSHKQSQASDLRRLA